jgi:hypothetical protein
MIHYILIKIQLIGTTMTYLIILYQQANAEASSKRILYSLSILECSYIALGFFLARQPLHS